MCGLSETEIKELHKKIRQPPKEFAVETWINWKKDIDSYNARVFALMSEKAKNFAKTVNISEPIEEMREIGCQFDDKLKDENLFQSKTRSEQMNELSVNYYYCSLRIVSTYQSIEFDSLPQIQKLAGWNGDAINRFLDEVKPAFNKLKKEIDLLRKDRMQWRVWNYENLEIAVTELKKTEGYSGRTIVWFAKGKDKSDMLWFGEWAPNLHSSLIILKRYLQNSDVIQLDVINKKKTKSEVKKIDEKDEEMDFYPILLFISTFIYFLSFFSLIKQFIDIWVQIVWKNT